MHQRLHRIQPREQVHDDAIRNFECIRQELQISQQGLAPTGYVQEMLKPSLFGHLAHQRIQPHPGWVHQQHIEPLLIGGAVLLHLGNESPRPLPGIFLADVHDVGQIVQNDVALACLDQSLIHLDGHDLGKQIALGQRHRVCTASAVHLQESYSGSFRRCGIVVGCSWYGCYVFQPIQHPSQSLLHRIAVGMVECSLWLFVPNVLRRLRWRCDEW
mmetsp:Transcript_19536/g.54279  ORF Transcript_19536/g.54279 Transcript_19536/m.54279 type:complete len:215 (-) Transcript_19536:958-1602(-)